MPEVITGLALLLLFVAVEVERGFWTVTIAHTTLTMGFVTVIVQARLLGFDRSLEEAAMDLGCPPLRTFMTVTLPLIAPAIAAGWVLAFMLSLDDLVIANFTTGPGATHACRSASIRRCASACGRRSTRSARSSSPWSRSASSRRRC